MMLTTKGRYAVMAIAEIAEQQDSGPMTLSEVSKKQNIALNYLEQIFSKLRKAEIVKAVKGPGGGYVLNKDLSVLTIFDIIAAVDENIEMTRCNRDSIGGCSIKGNRCKTHNLWRGLSDHIKTYFENISVADLVSNVNNLSN